MGKVTSRELPTQNTINNVLPGFTDTDRLGSLASSINSKTGKSIEELTMDGCLKFQLTG